ncbi:mannose-1-phosphate guanylyltransferase [Gleimia coleocanis]|nr:mannose-1-phosphate guanylyltransferase [Gleimia coleocanis]
MSELIGVIENFHAIIPAGGAGTRLWPLSRREKPKFLLPLNHPDKSMLQCTVERLLPVAESVTVVTGKKHYDAVVAQVLRYPQVNVIAEPSARDSMAAIGYAAEVLRNRYGDDVMVGSFAADHAITDVALFQKCVRTAVEAAQDRIVTLGIIPDAPSTAYGYIKPVFSTGEVQEVERFVEKPDVFTAASFVQQGYLWNGGIFVMLASLLKRVLDRHHPQLSAGLTALAREDFSAPEFVACWERLTKIAFDYAVAEPAAAEGLVAVVPLPARVGWSDVGDFAALGRVQSAGLGGVALAELAWDGQSVQLLDSVSEGDESRVFATDGTRLLVSVGLGAVHAVITEDVILIAPLEAAQQVKQVVELLENSSESQFL